MTMLEQGTISIHTENIFPIIKKWLYSDHEIFLRELISNAVDAMQKMKMVSMAGEYSGEVGEPEVVITLDKDNKQLTITDNGIGMTHDACGRVVPEHAGEALIRVFATIGADDHAAMLGVAHADTAAVM